jgi:D-tyrosyl-tRNA(Tyr) deacylase
MRAVVQRVRDASVAVAGEIIGSIDAGLLVYLGVGTSDDNTDVEYLARKIPDLRIFRDARGKMNLSLLDLLEQASGNAAEPGILVISQFTLFGDVRKGRRPSYNGAAIPDIAIPLYEGFVSKIAERGITVARGVFGEHMDVRYTNDGPVTIVIDSRIAS